MKKKISITLLVFLSIAGMILLKPVVSAIQTYLSKTEKVPGNVLIIEGWLSYKSLQEAIAIFKEGNYDYILTTGLRSSSKYYNVNSEGFLIFYPRVTGSSDTIHKVAVRATSELDGENSARFNLWINDSIYGNFTADRKKRIFSAGWHGRLDDLDSVMVEFLNDGVGDFGDRNLFVKEIIIDNRFRVPFLNNSEYDMIKLDGKLRIINNMTSNAEMTAKRLVSMGVETSKVIPVAGEKVRINRTLTSALAVRDWIENSGIEINGINIVSAGSHSRRTWMTFSKVLDVDCGIGIIALSDHRDTSTDKLHIARTIRETIALTYYWLILLPYSF